jgi:hypothetical protein
MQLQQPWPWCVGCCCYCCRCSCTLQATEGHSKHKQDILTTPENIPAVHELQAATELEYRVELLNR